MNPRPTLRKLVALAACLLVSASSARAAQTISINFQGRKSDGSGPTTELAKTDVAGVVPVANWNNVNDSTFTPSENGTTPALLDSTGATTPVTLTFAANDSWNNDVDPNTLTTGNAKMMNGVIKQQNAGTSASFIFRGVPEAQYDVYIYTDSNNDNVAHDFNEMNGLQSYYTIGKHQFADSDVFVQAKNTNPAGPRDVGNYVKLGNVGTFGTGQIGFTAKYISGGDGLGIAGIQLVNIGPAAVNTARVSLTSQPTSKSYSSGDRLSFTVTKSGPGIFQWFKNGVAVPGATNATYTTAVLTSADSGQKIYVTVSNNVNSEKSAEATITLAEVTAVGFLKEEFYQNHTRPEIEDPTFTEPPTKIVFLSTFETQTEQGSNFAERVSGLFTAPTTGSYIFFIATDDDGDLFLSTDATPANKKLIAQETGWSTARLWTAASSGDASAKRSDTFASSEWPTPNVINLTAGKQYYIEADHHEGGGGDNLAVTFIMAGQPDPANGSPSVISGKMISTVAPDPGIKITIGTQPASQTIIENNRATFSVAATATQTDGTTPTLFYQWQKAAANSTNFVDIAGATGTSLTTPLLGTADNGTKYRVVVSGVGTSLASAAATLTVSTDTVPPSVVSVGSLQHGAATEVGVIFNEPITAASATKATNYTLASGTVTAARYVANSSGVNSQQQGVVLTVTGVTPGVANSLTVKGVSDQKGNTITTAVTVAFTPSKFSWTAIGRVDPQFPPDAFAVATNGFNLINGGQAYWSVNDDITMVYEQVTGDFDKAARVDYSDPASNWARSGISVRESLNKGAPTTDISGDNPASRYQMVLADPATKFDGGPANNSYETNRRLTTGAETTSSNGGGTPAYPNAWLRLKRVGSAISMYRGSDGVTWIPLGTTDFGDPNVSDGPLPATMFVGPTYGAENGNVSDPAVSKDLWKSWATRIRQYGDAFPVKQRGLQTYSVGINFGSDETAGSLSSNEVAGVSYVAQGNWNNVPLQTGTATGLVAESNGKPVASTVAVEFGSNNTWASTGPRGELNNLMTGSDATLMTGYLDTGAPSTTHVTVSGIPASLTASGYDVYVYALGGVGGRGGGYRIVDANGTEIKPYVKVNGSINPTGFIEVQPQGTNYGVGNYMVFRGLKAATFTVEATTDNGLGFGGTPRAPINAIQIVNPVPATPNYSVGLNFGADEPNNAKTAGLAPTQIAGAGLYAQMNWNNFSLNKGAATNGVTADASGNSNTTSVTVSWDSNNTWSSTGRGEENNGFSGPDRTLMTGYLDTTATSTTSVTVGNIPTQLTGKGYDVVVYAMGGVGNKGGAYQVIDATSKAVLAGPIRALATTNAIGTYVQVINAPGSTNYAMGNYMVFSGLNSPNIIVQAITANGLGAGSTPRAPINAIQLVAPASASPAPRLSITKNGASVSITYSGTLQSADKVTGPFSNVAGATSPYTTTASGAAKFFRATQ